MKRFLLCFCLFIFSSINVALASTNKNLNVTVLLDLSNRIDPNNNYMDTVIYGKTQRDNDLEIVKQIETIFKKQYENKRKNNKAVTMNKMRVNLLPIPEIKEIFDRIEGLKLDLSIGKVKGNVGKRKELKEKKIKEFEEKFMTELTSIYDEVIRLEKYKGADIWGFFRDNIKYYIDDKYRNILIILTDGYIYDSDVKYIKNNRYSYIDGDLLEKYGLRTYNKAELLEENTIREKIKKEDFGLITTRNDLQNLEVLVLEVNYFKGHSEDKDVVKIIWEKWFEEMGIKKGNYKVCYRREDGDISKTFLEIENFFNKKVRENSEKIVRTEINK